MALVKAAVAVGVLMCGGAGVATQVKAQDWPSRPLVLVVPFAAGGGIDASARVQAQALGEILGQTVVVDNVGGAAGTVGTVKVMNAKPDGHMFLIGNSGTHAYSQSMYKKKPFDSLTDFEPVGLVTESPRIVIGRKDLPVANFKEFVAYAKANQAKMNYGSAGVGSGTHLPCALLNTVLGVQIEHVPFRGAGAVMTELLGGRIDYMCDTIQTGAARAKGGGVKGLAVMAPKRLAIIPELETTAEGGVNGVEATVWNGFFFPKATPRAIVLKLNKALDTMLARPEMRTKMEAFGLDIVPPEQRTPEYLAKLIPVEVERWGKVIRDAGITPE